jgi:hypothetical protein
VNRLADLCVQKDLILKITYSTYIGWSIRIHKRGISTPMVYVNNQDKEKAFEDALEEVKLNEQIREKKKSQRGS